MAGDEKMRVVAVVPAHNEGALIGATVDSLLKQVDEVIVACDNCTDNTKAVALNRGATAFDTVNNTARKAGALNQALSQYVDFSIPNLMVFICDADTQIAEGWVACARPLIASGKYDAVGSVFRADDNRGFLKYCQSLEWERYCKEILYKQKVFVLTGTASLIRGSKLKAIYDEKGYFYNPESITEDFTMTLDLKDVGAKLISPASCRCYTETMPSVRLLYLQRRRWYLGALQQVFSRKPNKTMQPYIFQQIMLSISIAAFLGFLVLQTILFAEFGLFLSPFWAVIGIIFIIERVVSVWHVGWKARLFAFLIIPELLYALILQISYLGALVQFTTGSNGTWNHVN
ncbi:glycosyltransferase family 2 protein [Weissella confusa]|uniref:glycosyltransferase family 2 protein n=1 Tax=Weissella confusa TaxID=1583 RepID=UPI001CE17C29|nr:glycosyltransferase family 2 protein [Weissella confusa]